MPVYNRERFLQDSITAILKEEFRDFELLICDDASTDNSAGIIQSFARQDNRIKTFTNSVNSGKPSLVHSFLSKQAQGNYIIASDSDDICMPQRLKILHEVAEKHPDTSIVYGKTHVIDLTTGSTLGWYSDEFDAARLIQNNFVPNGAALLRKSLFDAAGGYDETITWAEDYELRLRMALQGPFKFVAEEVYKYYMHPDNWTAKSRSADEEMHFKQRIIGDCKQIVNNAIKSENFSHTSRTALAYCSGYVNMQKNNIIPAKPSTTIASRLHRRLNPWHGTIGRRVLSGGFERLGLKPGMTVMVHSSLSSFGKVRGGADKVIACIQKAITDKGKLIMPTFTYQCGYGSIQPLETIRSKAFSMATPAVRAIGIIPETFRKKPNVFRSFHPIFSFAFWGRNAKELSDSYAMADSLTVQSPLGKLLEDDGYLLLLGVDLSVASLVHAAEYSANVPYSEYRHYFGIQGKDGKNTMAHLRTTGHSEEFRLLEGLLFAGAVPFSTQTIGRSTCRLVKARELFDAAVSIIRSKPDIFLCNNLNCVSCIERRKFCADTNKPLDPT
jgi:aminoglycoside 3-N-acetyltransferase